MEKYFVPEEDITAYELAIILAYLGGGDGQQLYKRHISFTERAWLMTPESIRRHFDDEPLPPIEQRGCGRP